MAPTLALAIAYTPYIARVLRGAGLRVPMGSVLTFVDALGRLGIGALSPDEGVARFLSVVLGDPVDRLPHIVTFSFLYVDGESLLDRTMVLYGSNLGNANTHVTTNLPTLFAGGGFRHGQHLAFDLERNYPLPNLFVSMLQRMGVEAGKFASSTGTMRGLEMV